MLFRYLAKKNDGNIFSGEISADSKISAEKVLQASGMVVELIQPISNVEISSAIKKFSLSASDRKKFLKIKYIWFDELSVMLVAGLNVAQCLQVLLKKSVNGDGLMSVMLALQDRITGGMALSEAMACCENIFSMTEIRSVRAAEKIGHPEIALQKLSAVGRNIDTVKKKIKAALVYPSIVLFASIISLVVLVSFVIPKFETMFLSNSKDVSLPAITRSLIHCCKFFQNNIVIVVACIICLWLICFRVVRNDKWRIRLLNILSKIPLFSRVYITINLHNFFRTIHMLLSFKMSLQDAMSLAISLITHNELKRSMQHVLSRLLRGDTLSECFQNCTMIPAQICGLIYAGEHVGDITLAFERASEQYENTVLSQLSMVTTLIEPIMIIILAIVVGSIAIALFLPMNMMIDHIM